MTEPLIPHAGNLTLGDILSTSGDPATASIVAIRHVLRPGDPTSLQTAADLTPERVREYTAGQLRRNVRFAKAALWLVFIADGQNRARFFTAYDNRGEIAEESTP